MSADPRSHLIHAFRKILRPLARILIRAGIGYDEFAEVIKGVYVESAIRDGISRPGPLTRSRVALATGVPRRDVDRYVDNESLLTPPTPTHTTTLAQVLHLWNTDPRYLGPYGVPLEIAFDGTGDRSFSDLVSRVNPDADPTMVLEDLTRGGVVVRSGERFLKVLSRNYLVADLLSPQALETFGAAMANLARTLEHNIGTVGETKLLQLSVMAADGLPKALLAEFDVYVKGRVQHMLEDVDDWIGKRAVLADEADSDLIYTGLTVFHYIEPPREERPLASTVVD